MNQIRHSLIAIIILALVFGACKKNEGEGPGATSESKVARFAIAIYKKAGSVAKEDYVATLARGEEVTLLKTESFTPANGKPEEYAFVELSGGKEGYVLAKHLANDAVVISGDKVKLYKRPNVTSGSAANAQQVIPGKVAFLIGEDFSDGEWLEITGGSYATYFSGWVRASDGVSRDDELVAQAVELEQLIDTIANPKTEENAKNEATARLQEIAADANGPVSKRAASELEKQGIIIGTDQSSPEDSTSEVTQP